MMKNMWIMVVEIVYIFLIVKISRRTTKKKSSTPFAPCTVNDRERKRTCYVMKSNRTHESDSDRNMLPLPIFSIDIPRWLLLYIVFHTTPIAPKTPYIQVDANTCAKKESERGILFWFRLNQIYHQFRLLQTHSEPKRGNFSSVPKYFKRR